jgi:hypothetical protein
VMIEYKHWTGELETDRRTELADKLEAQLRGQITGGAARFSVLIVEWPAFSDLDDASQRRFTNVIERVTEYGEGKGVTVKFR